MTISNFFDGFSKNAVSQNSTQRLASLDVYRGFVMFLMMAEVLEYCAVAGSSSGNAFWKMMCWNQSHVEWVGCALHDMIQPSFTFLVGVALPFSIAARKAKNQPFSAMLQHTFWRSLILIFLGIFLRSMWSKQTYFTFEDTLTQIGLGYIFLFLLGFQSIRTQILSFLLLLVGYWLAFIFYKTPPDFAFSNVGVPENWPHFQTGFAQHWDKNNNLAWAFDTWFLNLFPTEKPFLFNEGGYCTLSFIPTLGTMILGLFAGQILQNSTLPIEKIKRFVVLGVVGLAVGWSLNALGICPNVKRIWTPSWVLFSGGWCFLMLAAFYFLVDIRQIRRPFFWLTVIGMNSIAAYVMAHTVIEFINRSLQIHLGEGYDHVFGADYASLVRGGALLLVQWLVLRWMWKKGIFIKI
jgi:predicted acyltransferase